MKRALMMTLALAASASLSYGAAQAQDGGPDPHAPGAYAAQPASGFYDVEGRIAAYEAKASTMGRAGARVRSSLRAIKAFAAQQKARHGGELRDWDREALTARLDALQARTPALAG